MTNDEPGACGAPAQGLGEVVEELLSELFGAGVDSVFAAGVVDSAFLVLPFAPLELPFA